MSTCEWPFNLTRMSMDCGRNRHDDNDDTQMWHRLFIYLFGYLFVCLFIMCTTLLWDIGICQQPNWKLHILKLLADFISPTLILHTQKLFRISMYGNRTAFVCVLKRILIRIQFFVDTKHNGTQTHTCTHLHIGTQAHCRCWSAACTSIFCNHYEMPL